MTEVELLNELNELVIDHWDGLLLNTNAKSRLTREAPVRWSPALRSPFTIHGKAEDLT